MKDEKENKEWLNEYPMLKQVSPANAFVVPANYFEEMEQQLIGHVRLDGFKSIHPGDGFTVTENYFDELAQNIQSRIAIDEVLNNGKGFNVPADYFNELEQNIQSRIVIDELLNNEKGFSVPADYFDELEQNIQSRIVIDELLNNEKSFNVPADYFDELEQNIQSRIAIEESAEEEGFAIPQGYFENLEAKILAQTTSVSTAKSERKERQGIIVKLWASHAVKYATAACFSLVIGTGILVSEFNTSGEAHNRNYLHKQLSKIPDDEIETYLQLNSDAPSIIDNAGLTDVDTQTTTDQTKN